MMSRGSNMGEENVNNWQYLNLNKVNKTPVSEFEIKLNLAEAE